MADNNINEEAVVVIKADTTQLNDAIDKADQRAETMQSRFKQVGNIAGNIGDKLAAGVIRAQTAWQSFAAKMNTGSVDKTAKAQGEAARNTEKMTAPLRMAKSLSEGIANAWAKLTTPTTAFSKEAENARAKIREIEYALKRMDEQEIPTEAFREINAQIKETRKNLKDATSFAIFDGKEPDETPMVIKLRDELDELIQTREQLIQQGDAFKNMAATSTYQKLTEDLEIYRTKLQQLDGTGLTPLQNAVNKVGSTLAQIGAKGVSAFGSLLVKGVKKAASAIKSFFSNIKQHSKDNALVKAVGNIGAAFTRLFTMLKTRIKRTLVTAIFNDVKATFGEIAKINPQFNESVSSMVNSARQLGAQILAIFEPIITRVGPLISRGTEFLTNVADTLSQFTAKAFGFDLYTKAEKGQYNYAKSVDKTTNSTNKATKATKEFNKTVMGFDQLNKLGDTDQTDDISDSANAVLEKAEVNAEKAKSIGEKIWDAFNNHDYAGAGAAMAEGVNAAFDWLGNTFGWSKNMDVLTEKINNFGDTINGFIHGLNTIDIGKNIADIINTGINGLDLLLNGEHKIDFKGLGEKVGQLLISGFQNINWTTLGKDIAGALNGLGDAITGALTTTVTDAEGNEQTLGQALGTALRNLLAGAVGTWNVDTFSDTVSTIINTLADFFGTAFGDADTAAMFGAKLGQSITETLNKIDPDKMETAIHNFFYSLGKMLGAFVKNVDWGAVLTALWSGIKAGVSGVADALDDLIYGEWQRDIGLNQMDTEHRLQARQAIKEGKTYANNPTMDGYGASYAQQQQQRIEAMRAEQAQAQANALWNQDAQQKTQDLTTAMNGLSKQIETMTRGGIKLPDVTLKVNDREIARANMSGTQKINQQYNAQYGY